MTPDEKTRAYKRDMVAACALVVMGLAISALSLVDLAVRNPQLAQTAPPLQSSPALAAEDKPPAESKPGGTRPTTPAGARPARR
jgi:hypothetical protein